MRKFVMGDVHGAFKALKQCLERSAFDYNNDLLIQLGDVADGYDQVYECVEELLAIKNLIAIKGNHDEWFNQFCQTGYHEQHWSQGGKGTVNAYTKNKGKKPNLIASKLFGFNGNIEAADIPDTHKSFFKRQLLYHVDEAKNCFVHAGFNRHESFYEQRDQNYYWDRSLFVDAMEYELLKKKLPDITFEMVTPFNKIYIGHTPTISWKADEPIVVSNVVNMDTGAGWGARLSMINLDTNELIQSDPVTELYGYRGR
ncbi:MAG TPA: metallophosphoesterase [Flavitalea sp.]|nr:metallophosphoesterase [Flavitalea sp.]